MEIPIIYEDENVVVVDKPSGLLVHPTDKKEKNTLVKWLINKYPEIKNVGENKLRPGIVHRLDRDTSGLMVIAKNEKSFDWLKKQFSAAAESSDGPSQAFSKGGKIKKKYLALIIGKLKDKKGIITKAIGRSRKKGLKQTVAPIVARKNAITKYKVLKEYKNYSLIEAIPKTGRMHQIRVHLASIGHPIAGDKKYKFKRQICPENLSRQFLHASYLRFSLPDGKIVKFESKLPEELNNVLKKLQETRSKNTNNNQ